jgi:hypothetical protein
MAEERGAGLRFSVGSAAATGRQPSGTDSVVTPLVAPR